MSANKLIKPFKLPSMPSLSDIVKLYKLRAIRQLSQNFLLDKNINDKIIRFAGDMTDAFVVEVGPGPGGLTRSCIEAGAKHICVVEKDLRFMAGLQQLANAVSPTVRMDLHHGDALDFPFGNHINRDYLKPWDDEQGPKAFMIGNLPFNIATPLLFKLILKASDRKGIFTLGRVPLTFLFQQEFGERMIAPEGFLERSRVSVLCQAYFDVTIKHVIPNTAFVPEPKVNAAVVHLVPLKRPQIEGSFENASRVVKATFQFKKKRWILGTQTLFPPKYPEFKAKFEELCKVDREKSPYQLNLLEINDICHSYNKILEVFPELKEYDYRYNIIL